MAPETSCEPPPFPRRPIVWAGSPKGQEEESAQLETALYGAIAALPIIHIEG